MPRTHDSPSSEPHTERPASAEAEHREDCARAARLQQPTASALDSISEGFIILDRDWRCVFANSAAERFTLKSRAELLGRSLWDLFPEASNRRFGLEYHRAITENIPVHFEEFYPEPLNKWYEVRAYPSAEGLSIFFRDVTERRRVEEALRQSEGRYRSLFNSMTEGFAVHEIVCDERGVPCDYRFLEINPAFETLTGLKRNEVVGRLMSEVLPTDDPHWVRTYGVVAITGESTHVDHYSPAIGRDYDVFAYQSAPRQFAVLFHDITERKQAEAYREMGREVLQLLNEPGDLRASIQRVLAALKTRTGFDAVGIRLQDGDDFPYFVQEGFPKDFLLTENTLIHRDADGGLCRNKDGNVCLECTCGLVISGKTDPANPLFTPGGSCLVNDSFPLLDIPPDEDPRLHPRNQCIHYGYASVALVPIRNEDRVVGLIQLNDRRKGRFTLERVELLEGIGSHIGAALMRKQAEAALRASDERHRTILRTAMDGFWLVDMHGHLLEVNETYCRMSGYSAQELLAIRIPDLEAAETTDDTAAHMQTVMAQGEDRFESRHRRKDGSTFDVEVSVQYRPTEGGRFVVFLQDATERKRAEQQLERARTDAVTEKNRLEVVTIALSESEAALQRANDDLRAANEALQRNNEALEARVATRTANLTQRTTQLQALAREFTRAEERERQRIAQVVHDHLQQLLSVARINLGMALGQVRTESVEKSLSEVDGLIAESLDITRSLTAELSPAILHRSGLAAALRWLGRWYEDRFALKVLVEAADDADVEEETRVTLFRSVRELLFNVVKHARVASARVQLRREADGRVRIVVSDDGVGFDPEAVRAREGTGGSFGLFSLRERLELLGGQIEVNSEPGHGASFTIIAPLPKRVGPEAPSPGAASTVPPAVAARRHAGIRRRPAGRKKR